MKLILLTEEPYWATHAPSRFKGMNVTDPGISREEHIAIAKKAGLDAARRAIQYMYNMSLRNGSVDRVARLKQILSWIKAEKDK
jgi:hypothetical protein